MNKLQEESIKLYQEKIVYAKMQDPDERPNADEMLKTIGHNWAGRFCPYCQEYMDKNKSELRYIKCPQCPLGNTYHCCGGLWQEMNYADTWKEWIYYTEQIIKYVKIYG